MSGNHSSPSFNVWRKAVDKHLQNMYCITIVDAGIDDERLTKQRASREAADMFVDWFGSKYDLTLKQEIRR